MRPHVLALIGLLAGVCLPLMSEGVSTAKAAVAPIDPALAARLSDPALNQPLAVVVILNSRVDVSAVAGNDRADRQRAVIEALRDHADRAQAGLIAMLRQARDQDRVQSFTPLWITNAIAVTASRDVILDLARRPEVARIELDEVIHAPSRFGQAADAEPIEDNLIEIGAPSAWARGITGKGVVVALLDTGVDMTNPDLAARWRGGSNSWLDPYGEHPDAPIDVDGHGTHMLGVILGGAAGGSRIGVAPDAQWIAARVFNDRGRATVAGIHQALEWALDPDGDPATPDAPDVVNNSWSFANVECTSEFADDLRALRAAGILPVFAAGLDHPSSPANTPEALAVGALDDGDARHPDSPSGPATCADGASVFPQIVAPGAHIRTTDRFGLYDTVDGTSIAAAQVSGALALLHQAAPTLSADEQQAILTETAVDLGEPGPDNQFGYGRIDIAAALDRVLRPAPAPESDTSMPAVIAATPVPRGEAGAASLAVGIGGACAAIMIGLVIVRRSRKNSTGR